MSGNQSTLPEQEFCYTTSFLVTFELTLSL